MPFRSRSTPATFAESARPSQRPEGRIEFDLSSDRHALSVLEAYADACEGDMPWLAAQLRASLASQHGETTRCGQTVLRVFSLARAWAAEQPDFSNPAWEHVQINLQAALHYLSDAQKGVDTGDR
ncbi:MAG TPA: hypothetical protein VGN31_06990 [Paraburkholderia sp.]